MTTSLTDSSAMDRLSEKFILDWSEEDVHLFFSSLGFPQFQDRIIEDRITGDILVLLDTDTLRDFGLSIGQRLTVLKGIYQVKLAYGIEISEGEWVPPSELVSPSVDLEARRDTREPDLADSIQPHTNEEIMKLGQALESQAERIQKLESDNQRLNQMLTSLMEDFVSFRSEHLGQLDTAAPSISQSTSMSGGLSLDRKPSFKWSGLSGANKSQLSPTKSTIVEFATPAASPTFPSGSANTNGHAPSSKKPNEARTTPPPQVPTQPTRSLPSSSRQESSDNLKSFKVSLEDPTWKVLPAALKKYKINNDNWQNYAMFICYGSSGNRIERCLSYDEKPLLLFQKLKDAKKNPVFMLKHIKDIRSPIVVAQQKHAARKASSIASNDGNAGSNTGAQNSSKTRAHRPPKLEVHDLSTAPPGPESSIPPSALPGGGNALAPGSALLTSNNFLATNTSTPQTGLGWPQHELSSPNGDAPQRTPLTSPPQAPSSALGTSAPTLGIARELPPASATSQVSYAVAIYPYMAEQEDEFDVVVGDTFIILSRARGWWVVQRDQDGTGKLTEGTGAEGEVLQGWVPAGCLLETNVPVASAIAEAEASKGSHSHNTRQIGSSFSPNLEEPDTPRDADGPDEGTEDGVPTNGSSHRRSKSKTPILPLSIISTSFPGIALMEYRKKGEEELDLEKDDKLRVFKRYNHWSYAVKEDGGDRGWVPSWFIGKVGKDPKEGGTQPSDRTAAATPSNGAHSLPYTQQIDDTQVSPMSSAFPVGGTASAATSIGRI